MTRCRSNIILIAVGLLLGCSDNTVKCDETGQTGLRVVRGADLRDLLIEPFEIPNEDKTSERYHEGMVEFTLQVPQYIVPYKVYEDRVCTVTGDSEHCFQLLIDRDRQVYRKRITSSDKCTRLINIIRKATEK